MTGIRCIKVFCRKIPTGQVRAAVAAARLCVVRVAAQTKVASIVRVEALVVGVPPVVLELAVRAVEREGAGAAGEFGMSFIRSYGKELKLIVIVLYYLHQDQ